MPSSEKSRVTIRSINGETVTFQDVDLVCSVEEADKSGRTGHAVFFNPSAVIYVEVEANNATG